jgi:hypothetical protein
VSLAISPTVGIIAGGMLGPVVGLLVPQALRPTDGSGEPMPRLEDVRP